MTKWTFTKLRKNSERFHRTILGRLILYLCLFLDFYLFSTICLTTTLNLGNLNLILSC